MRRGLGSQVRVPADSRRSPAAAWRLGPLWGHKGGRPKGRRGLSGAWPLACEAGRARLAVSSYGACFSVCPAVGLV